MKKVCGVHKMNKKKKLIDYICMPNDFLLVKKGYVDAAIYQAHRFNPIMLAIKEL